MVQMTWNFQNKLVLTRRFEWWVVESKWEHMFQEAIMMLKFCFISTCLEIGAHLRWHECEYCGLYWHGDCFQHDLYTDNDFGYLTEQICQLQGSKRRSLFYNKSMLLWSRLDSKKGAIFVTFDGEKWGKIDQNNIRWHMLLLTSLICFKVWGTLKAMFIKIYDNVHRYYMTKTV